MRDRVVASGLVTPVERVIVQPLIEGQPIESLSAEVGDRVQKGDVLARLSDSTLKLQESQFAAQRASALASIAQADAQLLEAKATSDEAARVNVRTKALRAQGSSSQAAADYGRVAGHRGGGRRDGGRTVAGSGEGAARADRRTDRRPAIAAFAHRGDCAGRRRGGGAQRDDRRGGDGSGRSDVRDHPGRRTGTARRCGGALPAEAEAGAEGRHDRRRPAGRR